MDPLRPIPHISAPAAGEWYHALVTYPRAGSTYAGSEARDSSPWCSTVRSSFRSKDLAPRASPAPSAHSYAPSSTLSGPAPQDTSPLGRRFECRATPVRLGESLAEVRPMSEEFLDDPPDFSHVPLGANVRSVPPQAQLDQLRQENAVLSQRLQEAVFWQLQMERVVQDRESLSEAYIGDPAAPARQQGRAVSLTFLERRLKEAEGRAQSADMRANQAEQRATAAEAELTDLMRLLETQHGDSRVFTDDSVAATPGRAETRERGTSPHEAALQEVFLRQEAELAALHASQRQFSEQCRHWEAENRSLTAHCRQLEQHLLQALPSDVLAARPPPGLSLAVRRAEESALERETAVLRERCAALERSLLEGGGALELARPERDRLEERLRDALAAAAEAEAARRQALQEAAALQASVAVLTAQREQQAAALEELRCTVAQQLQAEQAMFRDQRQVAGEAQAAAQEVRLMAEALRAGELRIAALQDALEEALERQRVKEKETAILVEDTHRLQQEAAQHQAQRVEEAKTRLAQEEAHRALQAELGHRQRLLHVLEEEVAALRAARDRLQQQTQQLQADVVALTADLQRASLEAADARQFAEEHEMALVDAITAKAALEGRVAGLAQEGHELRKHISVLEADLREAHCRLPPLQPASDRTPTSLPSLAFPSHLLETTASEPALTTHGLAAGERSPPGAAAAALAEEKALLQSHYDALYGEWQSLSTAFTLLQAEQSQGQETSRATTEAEGQLRVDLLEAQEGRSRVQREALDLQARLQQAEHAKRAAVMEAAETKVQLEDLQQLCEAQARQLRQLGEKAGDVEDVQQAAAQELEGLRRRLEEFQQLGDKVSVLEDQLEQEGRLRVTIEEQLTEAQAAAAAHEATVAALRRQVQLLEDQLEEEGKLRTSLEATIRQGQYGAAERCGQLQREAEALAERLRQERNAAAELKRQLRETAGERDGLEEAYQEATQKLADALDRSHDSAGPRPARVITADKGVHCLLLPGDTEGRSPTRPVTTSTQTPAAKEEVRLSLAENEPLGPHVQEQQRPEGRLGDAGHPLEGARRHSAPAAERRAGAPQPLALVCAGETAAAAAAAEAADGAAEAGHVVDPSSHAQAGAEIAALRERIVMLTHFLKRSEKSERALQRELNCRATLHAAGVEVRIETKRHSTPKANRSSASHKLLGVSPIVERSSPSDTFMSDMPDGSTIQALATPTHPADGGCKTPHRDFSISPSPEIRGHSPFCPAADPFGPSPLRSSRGDRDAPSPDTSAMEQRLAQLEDSVAALRLKIQQRQSPPDGSAPRRPSLDRSCSPVRLSPIQEGPSPDGRRSATPQRFDDRTAASRIPREPRQSPPPARRSKASPTRPVPRGPPRHSSPGRPVWALDARPNPPPRPLEKKKVAQKRKFPFFGLELSDGIRFTPEVGGKQEYGGLRVIESWGPARDAGVMPSDFIVAVDAAPVSTLATFRAKVEALEPHTAVAVVVERRRGEARHRLQCVVQTEPTSKEPGRLVKSNIVHARLDGPDEADVGGLAVDDWGGLESCDPMLVPSSATAFAAIGPPATVGPHLPRPLSPAPHRSPQRASPSPTAEPRYPIVLSQQPYSPPLDAVSGSPSYPSPLRASSPYPAPPDEARADSITEFLTCNAILGTPAGKRERAAPASALFQSPDPFRLAAQSPMRFSAPVHEDSPPPPPPPLQHCSSPPAPLLPHQSSSPPLRRAPRPVDAMAAPPALPAMNPPW